MAQNLLLMNGTNVALFARSFYRLDYYSVGLAPVAWCSLRPYVHVRLKAFSHYKLSTRVELNPGRAPFPPRVEIQFFNPAFNPAWFHTCLSRTHLNFNPGRLQPRVKHERFTLAMPQPGASVFRRCKIVKIVPKTCRKPTCSSLAFCPQRCITSFFHKTAPLYLRGCLMKGITDFA